MQLIEAAVEQLRMATEREVLVHELSVKESAGPWTMTRLTDALGPHDFDDVSGDGVPPDDADPEDMEVEQDEDEELIPASPAPAHRLRRKRPWTSPTTREHQRSGLSPPEREHSSMMSEDLLALPREGPWQDEVHGCLWASSENANWSKEDYCVEIAFEIPVNANKQKQFLRDPCQYFAKSLKKKNVEVFEKNMTPEEKEKFKGAKAAEVRKFLSARALEALPPEMRPDKSQAVRMRWVLTYKTDDSGGQKPKARAVLLGFQDPEYSSRPTFAPTMTRTSRQLLLQLCSWKQLTCWKGDVSGAFLQGRAYDRELHCLPVPEICESMGLPAGSVCRLRKACYGLVEAPIEWFETVNTFLHSIGYRQLRSDPCTWLYEQEGQVISVISGHVDDFLFAGRKGCPIWDDLQQRIQKQFEWQEWEEDNFCQCGVTVSRNDDGSFDLSQKHYVESIPELNIRRDRRRQKHAPTTDAEKSQLRGLLGALSWHVGQVGYKYSAHVSLALSEVANSTVESLDQANKLLHEIRREAKVPMRIHAFPKEEQLCLVAWVDASPQNRHDGSSTEGILIGMAPKSILDGEVTKVSPMFWRSGKIDRVCRSPGSAEARAAIDGEDNLHLLRYAWGEFNGWQAPASNPESLVRRVLGVLVTDSRNVYDRVDKPYITPKGASKKIDLELLALKEAQNLTNLHIRWVHSDAQLANTLTKRGEDHQLARFIALGQQWRIVHDPEMFSGRKRKAKGMDPLENAGVS